jgi:hypothetical protein
MPVGTDHPARVAGLNQPGGPQIDPAALADPTAYTAAATARCRASQPKDAGFAVAQVAEPAFTRLFGRAKVGDSVPEMPVDLLRRIESHLQPGDILLQGADQDFRSETRGLYIHGMVYLGRGEDGTGYVVHAIGQAQGATHGELKGAVRLSAFDDSIVRDLPGTDRLAVLRPAKLSLADFNRLATFALGEVGKPYDYAFNGQDGERYYCTELVAKGIACLDPTMQIKPDPSLPLPMITDLSIRQAQAKGMLLPVMTVNPRPDR